VAQSTGSTEPRCGGPATSPWPVGHVLVHFQKNLATCPTEAVLEVSNAQRQYTEETWPPGQVAWPAVMTSGPHTSNLRLEHHVTPPINTTVLPPVEGVKKVRFSSPQGASKFNLCRVEREARFRGSEDFLACSESSE
jgi:hypothetical protein